MTIIRHILDTKGHNVFTVRPDDTVADALQLMADKDIGAVLVTDGDHVVGIFTERHYARRVFLMGRTSPTTLVREVMVKDVIYVEPDQSVESCMAIMAAKHIRHLPVLSDGTLVGIISIGDLTRSAIADREFNIEQLVLYVGGGTR